MSQVVDLSVVVPNYNHARFLPRSLGAIFAQSAVPREVLVIDDASTDDSFDVLREIAAQRPALRIVRNEINLGACPTIQRGLEEAVGKYVFFGGADDFVLPGFFAKSIELLECHPQAGLSSAWHSTYDETTGVISPNPSGWCSQPQYFSPTELESLLHSATIPGHTTVLRRSAVLAAGGFLPELEWHIDMFLNYVVGFRTGMVHLPEMAAVLRVARGTYSESGMKGDRRHAVINRLLDRLVSPQYADVGPHFERSGTLRILGLDLLRAAAVRTDLAAANVGRLVDVFTAAQYEELSRDPDERTRRLANDLLAHRR